MAKLSDFDAFVPLPPGLDVGAVRRAIDYIEKHLADLVEIYFEQANVFSAIVGIFGTKALDAVSNYEKHRHSDMAQQRFPDLRRRGAGENPSPHNSLESKGSKRPWAIQSHYDHAGWYIVWRYMVAPTETLEPGRPVIIWRVDVVFLEKSDWKYEKSSAGEGGGGRTHTFGVKEAAKRLAGKYVYRRKDVILRDGKPIPRNGGGQEYACRTKPRHRGPGGNSGTVYLIDNPSARCIDGAGTCRCGGGASRRSVLPIGPAI